MQAANAQAGSGAEPEEEGKDKEEADEKDKKKGRKKKPAARRKRGSAALEPDVICLSSDGDEEVIPPDNDRQTSGHTKGKGFRVEASVFLATLPPSPCLNARDDALFIRTTLGLLACFLLGKLYVSALPAESRVREACGCRARQECGLLQVVGQARVGESAWLCTWTPQCLPLQPLIHVLPRRPRLTREFILTELFRLFTDVG